MVAATLGDWDEVQIAAALRNTSYWTDTLYPGIDSLYGITSDPESAWLEYEQSVEQNLSLLGIPRDPDGSYRTTIGQMLNSGLTSTSSLRPLPSAACRHQPRLLPHHATVGSAGDRADLDVRQLVRLDLGHRPRRVAGHRQRAAVQYQAEQVGFDINRGMIEAVAENTLLSEREIAAAFNEVEAQLFSLATTV